VKADVRWANYGVTQDFLEVKADWISHDPGFPASSIMYFKSAGSLMRFSWFDYTFVGLVFFQTVIGLEGMLRLFYEDRNTAFKELLSRAVRTGVVSDATLSDIRPLPEDFRELTEKRAVTYSQQLASLLPNLRNDYLHGQYRLSPYFLYLALHVREATDALFAATTENLQR
jgi:hypothetical protein